jgi:hypothetical protein
LLLSACSDADFAAGGGACSSSTASSEISRVSPEIVLIAAPPACGKSTLSKKFQVGGYMRINQDTLGSIDKCLAAAQRALLGQCEESMSAAVPKTAAVRRQSVVIDNTNMDPAVRQRWIQLAKLCNVQVLDTCYFVCWFVTAVYFTFYHSFSIFYKFFVSPQLL